MSYSEGPLVAFTVKGTPKSVGGTGRKSRQNMRAWREQVRSAALRAASGLDLPALGALSVRITYFYWESTTIDVDNIAKPIIDALNGIVCNDDRQFEEIILRKTNHARDLQIVDPPPELAAMLYAEPNFIHVRCYGPPDHERLP